MHKINAQYTDKGGTTLDCTTHEVMGEFMDREFAKEIDAILAADDLQESIADFDLDPTTEYYVVDEV